MTVSRRNMLKAAFLLAGGGILSGCERVVSEATERLGQGIPPSFCLPEGEVVDPDFMLLSRAGYGPWPGDLDYLKRVGRKAWVEEQLDFASIDDFAANLRARRFETLFIQPGDCYDFKKECLRADLTRHTILRAVYSKRQLYEAMVGFWSDHLNINLEKGDCIYLKASDDMHVIRSHALGKFSELIRASAMSPAMLVYLDGNENRRTSPSDVPNENYARELLELHTLGVDGGYCQKDVFEAARCLTGWRLRDRWGKGNVYFDPASHDDGEKVVLGTVIKRGGKENDLERLVEIVCAHPSTAEHISRKLVRYLVSDDPSARLVKTVRDVFVRTGGDIKLCVREILLSDELRYARQDKFKRPFRFVVSSLRAVGADTHARDGLLEYLQRMGHSPFQYPTPDGFPEEMHPWLGSLLWRWNFAFALANNKIPSVSVQLKHLRTSLEASSLGRSVASRSESTEWCDSLYRYLLGREASTVELAELRAAASKDRKSTATILGLAMASPSCQFY